MNNEHSWPQEIIVAVWNKGQIDQKYDPSVWRYDVYGRWMRFGDYGNRDSEFGWEIDHIQPLSRNGSDELYNLQPLNWESNVIKSNRPTVI